MATVTMKLEGLEALQRAIVQAPLTVRAHAGTAIASTTFAIAQSMRGKVPIASGTLMRSIRSSSRGLSGKVEIGAEGHYWRFLEYGTRYAAARPFVRPAAEVEESAFLRRIRDIGLKLERDFSAGRFV